MSDTPDHSITDALNRAARNMDVMAAATVVALRLLVVALPRDERATLYEAAALIEHKWTGGPR